MRPHSDCRQVAGSYVWNMFTHDQNYNKELNHEWINGQPPTYSYCPGSLAPPIHTTAGYCTAVTISEVMEKQGHQAQALRRKSSGENHSNQIMLKPQKPRPHVDCSP